MKRTPLIIPLIILLAINANTGFCQVTAVDFKKLDWMEGTWKRTDTKNGESGREEWIKLSDTGWQGLGITLQGKDTSFVEKLKIVVRGKHIYYVTDIPGNPEPVWYEFTQLTETD